MNNENISDIEAVHRCLEGDKEAFRIIITRYKNLVYSLITRMVSVSSYYDDLAQEIFIKLYLNLEKYDPQYKFSTWVIKITTNHIIDFRRRQKIEYVPLDAAEYRLSTYDTPETEVLKNDSKVLMEHLIDSLPEMYRLPVVLYHQEDMSYKDISAALGIPLSKVKNRIHRARHMLREKYENSNKGDDAL